MLRNQRRAMGISRYAVGVHLGLSAGYIHDVEVGRRAPLALDLVARAAEYLGADPGEWTIAAARGRGRVEVMIPPDASDEDVRRAIGYAASSTGSGSDSSTSG